MFRTLYALTIVALIGGTAWAASGYQPEPQSSRQGGVGFALMVALQRGAAT